MPPSAATSQYPLPSGVDAMPTIGWLRAASPWIRRTARPRRRRRRRRARRANSPWHRGSSPWPRWDPAAAARPPIPRRRRRRTRTPRRPRWPAGSRRRPGWPRPRRRGSSAAAASVGSSRPRSRIRSSRRRCRPWGCCAGVSRDACSARTGNEQPGAGGGATAERTPARRRTAPGAATERTRRHPSCLPVRARPRFCTLRVLTGPGRLRSRYESAAQHGCGARRASADRPAAMGGPRTGHGRMGP